jgi:hypothetical protein
MTRSIQDRIHNPPRRLLRPGTFLDKPALDETLHGSIPDRALQD